jgi:CheY-like chemotaxis protein
MSVAGRGKINLGGYLNIGKFQHPYVREFYNAMILDVVKGLGTPMHRVSSGKDLEKLMEKIHLTHLFVGLEEYLSAADYLEKLAEEITVVVVSKEASQIPEGSFVTWMPKPLYGFPIASILNVKNRTEHEINRIYWPGTRALIVDDEAMNLHVASGILRRYGMEVSTALSGGAAISLCETETFDIVFLDHMMPEMDGVKTFRRIREIFEARGLNCPCIALTANALSHAREMFMTEGFDGFVSKPIEISELERVLKRVLPKASMIVRKMEGRNRRPENEAQGEDAGASRREAPR